MTILQQYGSQLLSSSVAPITRVSGDHTPHRVLSDVLHGRRDKVVLRHWEGHTRDCKICQENIRAYTAKYAMIDPFDLLMGAGAITGRKGQALDWADPFQHWLEMGIEQFGPTLRVAAGEANSCVYTDRMRRKIVENLDRGSTNPNDRLMFVTGPILSITEGPGPRRERTTLAELVRHPRFDLYYSGYRQRLHFRVSRTEERVYCETPHFVNDRDRDALFLVNGEGSLVSLFSERFDCLLTDPFVEPANGSLERFAFMTNEELDRLYKRVKDLHEAGRSRPYGELLGEELLAVADDLGIIHDGDATC